MDIPSGPDISNVEKWLRYIVTGEGRELLPPIDSRVEHWLAYIAEHGSGGASSWSDVSDKPFETVGDGLSVDEDGEMTSDVQSVNGKTGAVVLTPSDLGVIPAYSLVASGNTIPANHTMRVAVTTGALAITLGAPSTDHDTEYRLTLTAGAGTSLSVTPPTGYSIVYPDGVPTFADGKLYEFSFAVFDASHIVALYKEVSLT